MTTIISTNISTDTSQRHNTIATAVLAAVVGLTGLAALLDAVLTATGHPGLVGLGAAVLAVLVGTGQWVARRVRERREDAADLLAGAAWRAQHMPRLAAPINHDSTPDRAGVA
jgi:hypothetical protein